MSFIFVSLFILTITSFYLNLLTMTLRQFDSDKAHMNLRNITINQVKTGMEKLNMVIKLDRFIP
jgi:hypothetical protein